MKVWFVSVLIGGCFVCNLYGEEAGLKSRIDAYAKKSLAERKTALTEEKLKLVRLRKSAMLASQRAKRLETISNIEARIKELENPLLPYYAQRFLHDAKVGEIGRLDARVTVLQIVDGENAIVEYPGENAMDDWMNRTSDVRREFDSKTFWLVAPTAQFHEHGDIRLASVFYVTGTRAYRTLAGTKTVLVLEKVAMQPYWTQFIEKGDQRVWHTVDGREVTGSLVQFRQGTLTLLDARAKRMTLKFNELVPLDREAVLDFQRSQRQQ